MAFFGGYTRQALMWFGPTKFLCENGGDVNLSYSTNSLKNRFKWTHCGLGRTLWALITITDYLNS